MQTYDILIRPVITERATELQERQNRIAFEVHPKANKHQVRAAVEQIYGVDVETVRTMNVPGKTKRRGQSVGKRPNWKKALVTLKKGDVIDFFAAE